MQCQICAKRPAVVHFTEIVNNKKSEYHVCEKCAEEKGYHVPLVKTKFSVGDLLAGMVEQPGSAEEARVGRVQCPKCGLVYSNFKETGRLGCSECYPTFRSQLRPSHYVSSSSWSSLSLSPGDHFSLTVKWPSALALAIKAPASPASWMTIRQRAAIRMSELPPAERSRSRRASASAQ